MDQELIARLRKVMPEETAKELNAVEPMPSTGMEELLDQARSAEWLQANGYEPVSRLGLIWRKKER